MAKSKPTQTKCSPTYCLGVSFPRDIRILITKESKLRGCTQSDYVLHCIMNQPPIPRFEFDLEDLDNILSAAEEIAEEITNLNWGIDNKGNVKDEDIKTISDAQRDINANFCDLYIKYKRQYKKIIARASQLAKEKIGRQIEEETEDKRDLVPDMPKNQDQNIVKMSVYLPHNILETLNNITVARRCSKSAYITNAVLNQPTVTSFVYRTEDLEDIVKQLQKLVGTVHRVCWNYTGLGSFLERDVEKLRKAQSEMNSLYLEMVTRYKRLLTGSAREASKVVTAWMRQEAVAEKNAKRNKNGDAELVLPGDR